MLLLYAEYLTQQVEIGFYFCLIGVFEFLSWLDILRI